VKVTYSDFDRWNRNSLPVYNKYILDPLARLVALPLINHSDVKPSQVTVTGFIVSMGSAYLFWEGAFIVAALIFQVSVVLDLVDGHVARAKKNGSVAGILLDGYADIFRHMINILALAAHSSDSFGTVLLLLVFLYLNAAESQISNEFFQVRKFLKVQREIHMNRAERFMLGISRKMEVWGVRTIFLYYQERIFCVLFLGPVLGNIQLWTTIGILLVLISIHLRMILDVAIIKDSMLHPGTEPGVSAQTNAAIAEK